MSRIRVLLVDDHDMFRAGLVSLLGTVASVEVVAQASRGALGVRLARELRPDVILMDLRLPDLDGIAATRAVLADNPDACVILLTVANSERDISDALLAGARGYVLKDSSIEELVAGIQAVARGESWLSPRVAATLVARFRREHTEPLPDPRPIDRLSRRELDIVRLVARGLENAQIAAELNISPRTAKNHLSSVMAKLGLSNRVQVAIYAIRSGIK